MEDRVAQQLCDGLTRGLTTFDREHARFLDYLFSFAPADGEATARADRIIGLLSDDSITVRERATRDLVAVGRPALQAIRTLASVCPETRARCEVVRRELEGLDAVCSGWERDVPYLRSLDDPRARQRLDRIVGPGDWTELLWNETLDKYVKGD